MRKAIHRTLRRLADSRHSLGALLALTACVFMFAAPASAHVKWFSEFSFRDNPITLSESLSPTFWAMAALSIAVIVLLVAVEGPVNGSALTQRLDRWLGQYKGNGVTIMRIGVFATLLWAWQMGVLFAPELTEWAPWVGWYQFLLALLMLAPRTVPVGGAGLIALYFTGMAHFGVFHMLDYLLFVGVGYYLIVGRSARPRLRASGLPVMYATVGFCLAWLAAEKVIYPEWSLYLLAGHPQLTFGLDHRFFLVGCAFIEFSLGFLLIVGLFERLWALVITLTFFSTSTVFGKTEVIGHTIIHAALIVFLIEGTGELYRAPIHMPRRVIARIAASAVGFAALLVLILTPYAWAANRTHDEAVSADPHYSHPIEVGAMADAPTLNLNIHPDKSGGWNLEVITTNFRFAPDAADGEHVMGEGHAHLYVDGHKVGRIYGRWTFLPPMRVGEHKLRVTLNGNHHGPYTVKGAPIEVETLIYQKR